METSVDAVNKCLSHLDTTKAFGPDAVSPRLLKNGAVQLAPVLCRLQYVVELWEISEIMETS